MKINSDNIFIKNGKEVHSSGHTPSQKGAKTQSQFANELNKVISSKKSDVGKPTESFDVKPTLSLNIVNSVHLNRREAVEKLEQLLSKLEMFKNTIADLNFNKYRAKGLLDEIVTDSEQTIESIPRLNGDDPLRNIIADTAVTILTTRQRFHI